MSWSKKPTAFTAEVLKKSDNNLRQMVAFTLQQVITRSPVDSGEYRGSHTVTINQKQTKYNKVLDLSGAVALSSGLAVTSIAKTGDIVYVQTLSPYGLPLENGWSKQAPQGIYALTFQAMVQKFK